jgi:hypothetical protein
MVRRILSPDGMPEDLFDSDRAFARCAVAGLLLGVVFILSEEHGGRRPEPVNHPCQKAAVEAQDG